MSVEYQLNNGNLHLKTVFVKVGTTQLSSPLWSPLVTTLCCARAPAAWASVLTSVGVFCSSSCPQSEDLQQQQRTTAHNSTTAPQHVIQQQAVRCRHTVNTTAALFPLVLLRFSSCSTQREMENIPSDLHLVTQHISHCFQTPVFTCMSKMATIEFSIHTSNVS